MPEPTGAALTREEAARKNRETLDSLGFAERAARWVKTVPIRAKVVTEETRVATPEHRAGGRGTARAGQAVCEARTGEQWPQKKESLYQQYTVHPDDAGRPETEWRRYLPRPEAGPKMALQVDRETAVYNLNWGSEPRDYTLHAPPGGYVVTWLSNFQAGDFSDVWPVQGHLFEGTHERVG